MSFIAPERFSPAAGDWPRNQVPGFLGLAWKLIVSNVEAGHSPERVASMLIEQGRYCAAAEGWRPKDPLMPSYEAFIRELVGIVAKEVGPRPKFRVVWPDED